MFNLVLKICFLRNSESLYRDGFFYINITYIYTMYLYIYMPPEVFFRKRCSSKFHKIHRKSPVPKTLAQMFSCEF